jgi:hypothetical protein
MDGGFGTLELGDRMGEFFVLQCVAVLMVICTIETRRWKLYWFLRIKVLVSKGGMVHHHYHGGEDESLVRFWRLFDG